MSFDKNGFWLMDMFSCHVLYNLQMSFNFRFETTMQGEHSSGFNGKYNCNHVKNNNIGVSSTENQQAHVWWCFLGPASCVESQHLATRPSATHPSLLCRKEVRDLPSVQQIVDILHKALVLAAGLHGWLNNEEIRWDKHPDQFRQHMDRNIWVKSCQMSFH